MFMWILWSVIIATIAWMWQKKKHLYFEERGVKYLPTVPFIGNIFQTFRNKEHFSETVDKHYRAFPNERIFGSFEFVKPVVYVRDPELIRLVGVKDFEHFADHSPISSDSDPFFSKSLIGLKGDRWRDMRSTLSPAFTASKLKKMVPLIMDCNKEMINTLEEEILNASNKYLDLDTHDLLTRYANDVIATCAFGLKINSVKEKNNEFYEMAKKLTTFTRMGLFKLFLSSSFPIIRKYANFAIFDQEAVNFLENIVLSSMKMRDENKSFRPDMIQILLEVKKGTLKHENNTNDKDDAGFATVEESAVGKTNNKYKALRKWPPAQAIDRYCVKDYNMGKPNKNSKKDFIVKKGMSLSIPCFSLHRDPNYFPNPEKFDPDRFSDENKHNIKPFSYLPFGVGPRNCIGSRFALTEVKVMIFELIRRFEVCPAPQTVLPPRFDVKQSFIPRLEGGAWLRYISRQ